MTELIMLGSFALGIGLANSVAFGNEFGSKSGWWRVGALFLPPIIAAWLLGGI